MSSLPPLRCSFCGKHQGEVARMIAGPSVYVCDQCITLMSDMVFEGRDLPPRVRAEKSSAFARRDTLLVEVKRALEVAFPERAASMLQDLEAILPPGGPLICHDCREAPASIPNPCPEDWVCADWREETWTKQSFKRAEGMPAAWPWLLVLERNASETGIDYVLLAPLILRRPVQFRGRTPVP